MKQGMKAIFALLLIVSVNVYAQQPAPAPTPDKEGSLVKWMSLKDALSRNEKNPKPILLDFYTDWCGWCKHMMKTTYADPNMAAYINMYFYPAKINAEGNDTIDYLGEKYFPTGKGPRTPHPLTVKLLQGRLSYPTTLFLNGYDKQKQEFSLNMIASGYLETNKLEPMLVFSLENVYRNSNYDDFRVQFERAFYDSTINVKLTELNWNAPKDFFNTSMKTAGKKTLVFINSEWCNGCKVMKRTSFLSDSVLTYLSAKFNIVDFNPDIQDSLSYNGKLYTNPRTQSTPFHQLAFELTRGNISFPSVVLLDEEQKIMDVIPFYLTPKSVDDILHYYGDDINKVKSWQDYVTSRK